MKCIGAANPPCDRCRKAGRECVSQKNVRGTAVTKQSTDNHVFNAVSWTPATPATSSPGLSVPTGLPSVYSTSPFAAVVQNEAPEQKGLSYDNHRKPSVRDTGTVLDISGGRSSEIATGFQHPISERDMTQIIQMRVFPIFPVIKFKFECCGSSLLSWLLTLLS
jgi:hypothetical protein